MRLLVASILSLSMATAAHAAPKERKIGKPKLPAPQVWKAEIDPAKDAIKGSKKALVTLVLYADFQDKFTRRLLPTLDKVMATYGKKVRLVFKHNPMAFHKLGLRASEASLCAKEQKKFWALHDLLFKADPDKLAAPDLMAHAKTAKLKMKPFEACLTSRKYEGHVKLDMVAATRAGARGVPNTFVNGVRLTGAKPYEDFAKAVDAQLAHAKAVAKKTRLKGQKLYDHLISNGKVLKAFKDPVKLPTTGGVSVGDPATAKHVVTVFSSLEGPYDARLGATLMRLVDTGLPKNSALVVRFFPLSFHKKSKPASRAVLCADAQGVGFKMLGVVYARHRKLADQEPGKYAAWAKEVGVKDAAKFASCFDAKATAKKVMEDYGLGRRSKVRGTPSVFVDGRYWEAAGVPSVAKYLEVLTKGPVEPSASAPSGKPTSFYAGSKKKCDQDASTCFIYATLLLKGGSEPGRFAVALKALERGCMEGKDGDACMDASAMYSQGNGVPFDAARAKKLEDRGFELMPEDDGMGEED